MAFAFSRSFYFFLFIYPSTADKLEVEFSFLAFVMTVPNASRFSRYLAVFLRWLLIGATVFAMAVWLGLYIRDNMLPKSYTANAIIQVPASDLVMPGKALGLDSSTLRPVFEGTIRAPDFLLPVIDNLNLDTAWASHPETSTQEKLPDVDVLSRMENMLNLTVAKDTNLVTIAVSSADPKEAADIANAIADQYQTLRGDAPVAPAPVNSPDQQTLAEIAKQQKVVDDKMAEVESLREQLDANAIPGTVQARGDTEKRQEELLAAKAEYDARVALQAQVADVSDDEFISILAGAGDITADFNSRLTALQNKTPPNRAQISDLIGTYRTAMKVNLDMAKSRVALLQKEVKSLTAMTQEQSPEYRHALIDLDQQQRQLDVMVARSKETEPAPAPQEASLVQIVSRAVIPTEPTRPDKQLDFIVIVVGATILAILAASFAEVVFLLVRASQRTDN
jgi:uncharacterized protein involved in exopolysaccharide biosynthesis